MPNSEEAADQIAESGGRPLAESNPAKRQLAGASNKLIEGARDVQRLEEQKRKAEISTPEFHRLADAIEARARDVFRLADDEERLGDQVPRGEGTIEDEARRHAP